MGRIKTTVIKRSAIELHEKHSDRFTTDFQKNKKIVDELADIPTKKFRNIIAGFVTRLKKNEE